MSGSYDECVGADDTMDSFWEVQTHRHVCSDELSTKPLPSLCLVLIWLLKPNRVTTETNENDFTVTKFLQESLRSCSNAV